MAVVVDGDPMPFSGTVTGGTVTLSRTELFQDSYVNDQAGNFVSGSVQLTEQYVLDTSKSEIGGAYTLTNIAYVDGSGSPGTLANKGRSSWTRQ